MTTASRSLATAATLGRARSRLAPPSYTTSWDRRVLGIDQDSDDRRLRVQQPQQLDALGYPTKKTDWRRAMRAIGLVLLSIAIMALLLTDADAQRRSSAQGSQAAGAKGSWCATYPSQGLNDNCSYSSFNQCYQTAVLGRGGFCRPNPFPGTPYGTGYTWSGPKR